MNSTDNNMKSNRKHTGVRKTNASTTISASVAILLMGAILTLSSEARHSNLAFIAGNDISLLQQQQYLAFATNSSSDLQSSNTTANDTTRTTAITNTTVPTTAIPISDEPNHVAIIGQEAPFYGPDNMTVKVGTTVTFKNHDAIDHTATGTNNGTDISSPVPNNTFDTGLLKIGQEKQVTFDKAGIFHYFCTIHPFMRGTLTVTAA